MRPSTFLGLLALPLLAAACACQPPCDSNNDSDIVATKYVHRYGVTIPQYQWEEAGQSGQIVTTRNDGVCCSQSYYCGNLDGDTTHTFPFSNGIEKVQTYSQNELIKEVTYHPSGQIRTETTHNPPEPTQVREWYENGTLKLHEKYAGSQLSYGEYYNAKGERSSGIESGSGLKAMHDTYGALWGVEERKGGEVIYRTTYYPNGSPKEIDPYKDGVLTGLRKTYYPGGEPQTIETWVDGKQEGLTTIFKEGEKSQEIPYKNGLKNGVGRLYRDGAIVVQEITWKDDKMHGPSRTYIEDRVATEWYFKGNKVTKGYYDSFQIKPFKETPSVEAGALETAHLPSLDMQPDSAYPSGFPEAL
jgi:antitoxin component YwqK of YwqJK toxin-antitoxin module